MSELSQAKDSREVDAVLQDVLDLLPGLAGCAGALGNFDWEEQADELFGRITKLGFEATAVRQARVRAARSVRTESAS